MSSKVIFKTYQQDQLSLLPPSYDELVPKNHPVRIVKTIIDHIDISTLEKSYKGGGTFRQRKKSSKNYFLDGLFFYIITQLKNRSGTYCGWEDYLEVPEAENQ